MPNFPISKTDELRPTPNQNLSGSIQCVSPLDDPEWDARLVACRGASFFHSAAWARVLQEAYGYVPLYFTTGTGDRIHSLLPIMEVNSWLTGRRGVSLPFTDECRPLCADSDSFRRLHEAVLEQAKGRKWRYFEFRGGQELFEGAPASTTFLGHHLNLRRDEAALFAACGSKTRGAIKQAEQGNLAIEFSRSIEAVRTFHTLLCKTRRRHGVPPQPFHFFESIHRHVLDSGKGWVVLATSDGRPVAGAIYFNFEKTAIYKYAASDEAFQQLRGNDRVMWEAIKRYAKDGFEVLDFGRTSPSNVGLQKFKRSWGTTEYEISYLRFDVRTGSFVQNLAETTWDYSRYMKMLPEPIFRLVGSLLYKHVA